MALTDDEAVAVSSPKTGRRPTSSSRRVDRYVPPEPPFYENDLQSERGKKGSQPTQSTDVSSLPPSLGKKELGDRYMTDEREAFVPREDKSRVPQWIRAFAALMYRSWLQKRRSPIASTLELLIPILGVALLLWPRGLMERRKFGELRYMTDPYYAQCPFGMYGPNMDSLSDNSFKELPFNVFDFMCNRWDAIAGNGTRSLLSRTSPDASFNDAGAKANIHLLRSLLPSELRDISGAPFVPRREYSPSNLMMVAMLPSPEQPHPWDKPSKIYFTGPPGGCDLFGQGLNQLLDAIAPGNPDSVAFPGDICVAEDTAECLQAYEYGDPSWNLFHRDAINFTHINVDDAVFAVSTEDDTTAVVIQCANADDGEIDVSIRMNSIYNNGVSNSIPDHMAASIKSDGKDLLYSPESAIGFAGNMAVTTIDQPPSPTFLDWAALVNAQFLLMRAGQSLQQTGKKLLPEEPELMRSISKAISTFDLIRFPYNCDPLYRAACLVCNPNYKVYQHRSPELALYCGIAEAAFSALLSQNISDSWKQWRNSGSEPPSGNGPIITQYCSSGEEAYNNFYWGLFDFPTNSSAIPLSGRSIGVLILANLLSAYGKLAWGETVAGLTVASDGDFDDVRRLSRRRSFTKQETSMNNMLSNGDTVLDLRSQRVLEERAPADKNLPSEESVRGVNVLSDSIFIGYREAAIPTPPLYADDFLKNFGDGPILSLFYIGLFSLPLWRVSAHIMLDKETKVREVFKIMGCTDFAMWSSLYIFYGLWYFIPCWIMAIMGTGVFIGASTFAHFLLLWLFTIALVSFSVLVTSIPKTAKTAGTLALAFAFGISVLFSTSVSDRRYVSVSTLLATMLGPTNALAFGLAVMIGLTMAGFENAAERGGLRFSHLGARYRGVSMQMVYLMLLVDIVVYFLLGWYLHQVWPGDFGIARPWYFLFTSDFWKTFRCLKRGPQTPRDPGLSEEYQVENLKRLIDAGDGLHEPFDPKDKRKFLLSAEGVGMTFYRRNLIGIPAPPFQAVKTVSFGVREGEIFALLGHNGAGKTTTINVLTGMLTATQGDAFIRGYSIARQTDKARENIGFCPQHDILFPFMTVKEHLRMFGMMRGVKRENMDREIEEILTVLHISEKVNFKAQHLSGGQKRRLSVAIALIGGATTIFLDEPSTGMDPFTRRALWETLRAIRPGRAILLTTHFMEEADVLGDRIGIMADGKMRCTGSTMFLKRRIGSGYTLVTTKSDSASSDQLASLSTLVSSRLPGAELVSDIALETAYRIPYEQSPSLAGVLLELEQNRTAYGIVSFTVSITSLEDVFLAVADEAAAENADTAAGGTREVMKRKQRSANLGRGDNDVFSSVVLPAASKKSTAYFRFRQLRLLTWKRFKIGLRDLKGWALQLLLPVLLLLIFVGSSNNVSKLTKRPAIDPFEELKNYPYQDLTPLRVPCGINADEVDVVSLTARLKQCTSPSNDRPFFLDMISVQSAEAFEEELMKDQEGYAEEAGKRPVILSALYFDKGGPTVLHSSSYSESISLGAQILTLCFQASPNRSTEPKYYLRNWPLPRDKGILANVAIVGSAWWAAVGITRIPAGWGAFAAGERNNMAKHAQHVAGVPVSLYWLSIWMWDTFQFIPSFGIALAILAMYGTQPVTSDYIGSTVLAGVLFGFASSPFISFWSVLAKNADSLNAPLTVLSMIAPILCTILGLIPSTAKIWQSWLGPLLFLLSPQVAFSDILIVGSLFWSPNRGWWDPTDRIDGKDFGLFHWRVTGMPLFLMFISALAYFGLTVFVDNLKSNPSALSKCAGCVPGLKKNNAAHLLGSEREPPEFYEQEDMDVKSERHRVEGLRTNRADIESGAAAANNLIVYNLRKVFPAPKEKRSFGQKFRHCSADAADKQQPSVKVAVRDLAFGVPAGQCFGFLGVNGAGKTTSIQMLTGLLRPTAGTAVLADHDVTKDVKNTWVHTGYCPQFDNLFEFMTGAEHLEFYAGLSGVEKSEIPAFVDRVIQEIGLEPYRNRIVNQYSGGNRRKLCVGLAFLKNPQVVFLDEPSSGVDPASRRRLWDIIARTTSVSKRSVVLTTHSMEECEALCDRLCIMQDGRLVCLGTPSHLKYRFGQGFQLEVTLKADLVVTSQQTSLLHKESLASAVSHHSGVLQQRLSHRLSERFTKTLAGKSNSKSTAKLLQVLSTPEPEKEETEPVEATRFLKEFRRLFPNTSVYERVGLHLKLAIPRDGATVGSVFEAVEQMKEHFGVQDYAVSEASLESIFVQFQRDADVASAAVQLTASLPAAP